MNGPGAGSPSTWHLRMCARKDPPLTSPWRVGILSASGQLDDTLLADYAFLGELSLDGSVRPVRGALSMTMEMAQRGVYATVLPHENMEEAAMADGPLVYGAHTLTEAIEILGGSVRIPPYSVDLAASFALRRGPADDINFSE